MTEPATTPQTTPAPALSESQRRFTFGVIYDVAKTLEVHGFGPFDGDHYRELMLHLFHFLFGGADHCNGHSAASVEARVPAPPDGQTTSVEAHRLGVERKLDALRESGEAVQAALARYDERWGVER